MKTLFYPAFDTLEIRDMPAPEPQSREVLMRVQACGLCGSELETFKHHSPRRQPPLIMGHEFCGTVTAVGTEADPALIGRRFVSNSLVPCGQCARCRRGDTHLCGNRQIFGMHRKGAFAEYAAVPQDILIPWADEITAEEACLTEPLANGIHVVNLTRHLRVDTVMVIGAGSIGLMCQQTMQALRGARVMVCDLSLGRLEVASKLGAARTVCSRGNNIEAEALKWTEGEGVDLVVDAAGTAGTKRSSIAALRPGGAAVWIGLYDNPAEFNTYDITLQEKQVLGTYSAKMEELVQALELIRSKKVDVSSWVETVPIENSVEIFHRMLRPGDRDIKAVFVP
jgi:L-iditol 2-dehydrogenase